MRKMLMGMMAMLVMILAIGVGAPAQAGGNIGCAAGSRQIPGGVQICAHTEYTAVRTAVDMDKITIWIAGDASQLESGNCGSGNPAATYDLRIEGADGTTKWNPAANCLDRATGYDDVWTKSLDPVPLISPNSRLFVTFHLRDNGGTDSTGTLVMTVD